MSESEASGAARSRGAGVKPRMMRRPEEFEAVLRSRIRSVSRNFVARARPNDFDHPRLGIIAGRKAAARAVDRNRAKRLIREAFRAAGERAGAYDIAVQLKSDLRGEDNAALRKELDALLDTLLRETRRA
ncbi:MAG TPA: ribonuclease P protein component [Burkholderiales bacterium]|nr:ribonuclease P protein component [Burkholderiales bacterium]